MDWVENVTGVAVDNFYRSLGSGQLLCRLINVVKPGMIKKIHEGGIGMQELVCILALCNYRIMLKTF